MRRGRGGKEKEWIDCVQSDVRAFGIAGDWKATALEAGVWVETVTEGVRRFMAAWRNGEEDAARHRQKKREVNKTRKVYSSIQIVLCQEENHYHGSIWEFTGVILFCRVIIYCRMWPIIISLQTSIVVYICLL